MGMRVWKSGDHEVAETVLRTRHEPREQVSLEGSPEGESKWRVLTVERDPHGWRTIAARCLPECPGHAVSDG